jgi:hypothetical protein
MDLAVKNIHQEHHHQVLNFRPANRPSGFDRATSNRMSVEAVNLTTGADAAITTDMLNRTGKIYKGGLNQQFIPSAAAVSTKKPTNIEMVIQQRQHASHLGALTNKNKSQLGSILEQKRASFNNNDGTGANTNFPEIPDRMRNSSKQSQNKKVDFPAIQ